MESYGVLKKKERERKSWKE